jgi:hypothetical protein
MVQNVSHEDGFEGPGGVVGFVVLAVVAAVVWWMVGAHEPEAGAQRAFASSVDEGGWYEFGEGDVGVVVYPGAWVDAEAYALTARELSSETGAVVAVVRVPLDVAPERERPPMKSPPLTRKSRAGSNLVINPGLCRVLGESDPKWSRTSARRIDCSGIATFCERLTALEHDLVVDVGGLFPRITKRPTEPTFNGEVCKRKGRGIAAPALLSVAASAPAAIPYALKNGMLVRPHNAIALRNPAIRRLSLLSLVLIASPPSLDSPCSSPQKSGVLAALQPGLVPTVVRPAGRG